jgi:hypothetical protein
LSIISLCSSWFWPSIRPKIKIFKLSWKHSTKMHHLMLYLVFIKNFIIKPLFNDFLPSKLFLDVF